MNHNTLRKQMLAAIRKDPLNFRTYEDYFRLCINLSDTKFKQAHQWNHALRSLIADGMRMAVAKQDWLLSEDFNQLLYRSLLFGAPYFFDDYLQAVEFQKDPDKKFYQPRRHCLKPIVDAYQRLLDGEIRFLSVSMPKRTGKSQTGINFCCMMAGKYPDKSILMEGAGDDLVNSFYKGCLEYLQVPNNYQFYEIFPTVTLAETNAKLKTLNLNSKSRFPTIMCRSIDASQVGLSEATSLLYLDDCVESRMEAKNRQRLDTKWETISGDVLGRAIENTPIVICGTRYSLYDPIGRMQDYARKQGWKWEAIEIPALDLVTDESNWEYMRDGRPVFTTQYFREQRDLLSAEQFESEFQQTPFEAKGLLFPKEQLNYYYELPIDKAPDAIVSVCDTAENGEDSVCHPVAYVYGEEVYIEDVVFDDAPPIVTKPEVAKMIIKHNVLTSTFESNNAGSYYARDVQNILKAHGYNCSIRTKRTISNKQTRIEFASDRILKNFYFKHPSLYAPNSQYGRYMKELTTYTRSGKVAHDDAPDGTALLENELRFVLTQKIEIVPRPF